MSFLLLTYILNSTLLFFLGLFFLRKYYNLGGAFFLIFCSTTALWFIFFFLSYFSTSNLALLLLFGKISYYLSIVSLYSFILFLFYFHRKKQNITHLVLVIFWAISGGLGLLYVYSPLIISGLHFDQSVNDWYETPGILYNLHIALSFLFIPLSLIAGIYRFKNALAIDKKRLQYIYIGMLLFIFSCFLFLLILPLFGIRGHMDRYVSFFFIPFIVGVFYAIRRYDFLDIRIVVMKVVLFLYSLGVSFFTVKILRELSSTLHVDFRSYWGITDSSLLLEMTIGIVVFLLVFRISRIKIGIFFTETLFDKSLEKMKTQIPFILNLKECNVFLSSNFSKLFNIDTVSIVSEKQGIYKDIAILFENNTSLEFIMNDIVFLEENKKKLGVVYESLANIEEDIYIIFPLKERGENNVIGFFQLGTKSLKDPFLTSEFVSLQNFSKFLSSHLKYIDIYSQIQELTVSLDKKVDEKTIEFNNLVNKQKEFIAYVGHEIKNPITNTLFLSESIKQDIEGKVDTQIVEDAQILYDELIKVSKLVKYIFSAEKFDLDKVELYKTRVNISQFLLGELDYFTRNHESITFDSSIEKGIILDIDETQFRQVVQNLVNNSIKFIDRKKAKISLSLYKKGENISIDIEDNGKGFSNGEADDMFSKYVTGMGSATGLGMGLYLCKKIVELHEGEIWAQKSKKLGGACFSIKL